MRVDNFMYINIQKRLCAGGRNKQIDLSMLSSLIN